MVRIELHALPCCHGPRGKYSVTGISGSPLECVLGGAQCRPPHRHTAWGVGEGGHMGVMTLNPVPSALGVSGCGDPCAPAKLRSVPRCNHLPQAAGGRSPGSPPLTGTSGFLLHTSGDSLPAWPGLAEELTLGQPNGGRGVVATAGPGRPARPACSPCDRPGHPPPGPCVTSLVQEGGPGARVGSHQQAGPAKRREGPSGPGGLGQL